MTEPHLELRTYTTEELYSFSAVQLRERCEMLKALMAEEAKESIEQKRAIIKRLNREMLHLGCSNHGEINERIDSKVTR